MSDDFDFNELTQSEEPADALLRALKYDFAEAADRDADRESPADPLLTRRLEAALRRLNPWLSDDNLRKAVRAIRQVQAAGLIEANEKVHVALTHGVSSSRTSAPASSARPSATSTSTNRRTTSSCSPGSTALPARASRSWPTSPRS